MKAYQAKTGLTEAVVGYFDPGAGKYLPTRTGHVEICAGLGNVSLRDGEPFIHLHLVLSDRELNTDRSWLRAGASVTLWVSPRGHVGSVSALGTGQFGVNFPRAATR